jgi:hypothetical protein
MKKNAEEYKYLALSSVILAKGVYEGEIVSTFINAGVGRALISPTWKVCQIALSPPTRTVDGREMAFVEIDTFSFERDSYGGWNINLHNTGDRVKLSVDEAGKFTAKVMEPE